MESNGLPSVDCHCHRDCGSGTASKSCHVALNDCTFTHACFPVTLYSSTMSTSQGQEDVYETQNDQRLDELHSKIRTLRGVRFPLSNQ